MSYAELSELLPEGIDADMFEPLALERLEQLRLRIEDPATPPSARPMLRELLKETAERHVTIRRNTREAQELAQVLGKRAGHVGRKLQDIDRSMRNLQHSLMRCVTALAPRPESGLH